MYFTVIKFLAPVVLVAGAMFFAHSHGVKSERARWEARAYQATIDAHETAAKFTSGVIAAHNETEKNAQTKIDKHDASVIIADNASDRLRDEIDAYIKQTSDSSAAFAEYRATTQARFRVLADMHRLSDKLAGIYANQADKNRIAGEACVAAYESLKSKVETGL